MVERINPMRKIQAGNCASCLSVVTLLSACIVLEMIFLQLPCYAAERSAIGPSHADAMLADYFRAETAKLRDRCLTGVKSLEDWQAKRKLYREQLFEMLGLMPLPEKTDLKPVVTGKIEHE